METSEKQVMELFVASQKAMAKANLSLSSVDAIFFCEGLPDSWPSNRLRIYSYHSMGQPPTPLIMKYNALDLGQTICKSKTSIQAPFRRGFRLVRTGGQGIGEKKVFSTEDANQQFPDSIHFPDPRNPSKNFRKKRLSLMT